MVKISAKHKKEIKEILGSYTEARFASVLEKMTPILRTYHIQEPKSLTKRLLNNLFGNWLSKENEAIVHYWTLCQLVHEFRYSPEQIELEVQCGGIGRKGLKVKSNNGQSYADVVVYTHPTRRAGTALIAIECRVFQGPNGSRQAASYARALQARFHLFTDSAAWSAFETLAHPLDGEPIANIPTWVGVKPLPKRLSKKHQLPPLVDEKQLRDLVEICHNSIHSEGLDPAKAFDELVKLLFVKIYDEQEIPEEYLFSKLHGETNDNVGKNIRSLLREARQKSKYRNLFTDPGDDEFSISNKSITTVVEMFQGFSFTGNSLIGIDIKGTVYENMVGSTFRGELGQYFTPRKMVEFIVNLLRPTRDDFVLDPACGSGGFLIYTLKKVASQIRREQENLPIHKVENLIREFANEKTKGFDINPRMVRAARMNMIMHGDGWAGIQRDHGLLVQKKKPQLVNGFTLILSNPPFAGFEKDADILKDFEVGKNESGNIRGVNRAIVFIEQILSLLAIDGRAGLVLPRSIFENDSFPFKKIREIILRECEIIAIIGLPRTAFHHTDCGILGDLLFVRKVKSPRQNYSVFIDWAENVGYNTLGHNIDENDFPEILNRFERSDQKRMVAIKTIKSVDNFNPWFFHPKSKRLRIKLHESASTVVPLTSLIAVYENRISRKVLKQTPERILRYLEVRDFDPATGVFEPKVHKISTLPSRATYELTGEELILLPNARNSLESGRRIIKVGAETNGIILTNRFTPLIPKVNGDFLVLILNKRFIRDQIIAKCTGAGSPDFSEAKLNDIMVPVPDPRDLGSIDIFMNNIENNLAEIERLKNEIVGLDNEIDQSLEFNNK